MWCDIYYRVTQDPARDMYHTVPVARGRLYLSICSAGRMQQHYSIILDTPTSSCSSGIGMEWKSKFNCIFMSPTKGPFINDVTKKGGGGGTSKNIFSIYLVVVHKVCQLFWRNKWHGRCLVAVTDDDDWGGWGLSYDGDSVEVTGGEGGTLKRWHRVTRGEGGV